MGIYIALGGNQKAVFEGHTYLPAETFLVAIQKLGEHDIALVQASNLWQSPAWPDPDAQPPYINAVIEVQTKLPPQELLERLKQTESAFGRIEGVRNAPRPLDLDILDYDGRVINYDGRTKNNVETLTLTLPHPRMLDRPFVLMPLAEIAPDWTDPIKKRAISDWTARLRLEDVTPMIRMGPL